MSFQLSLSTDLVTAAYPYDPLLVAPDATVGDVLQLLRAQKTSSVLICDGDGSDGSKLLGIFTERDALKWMAASKPLDRPISEAMSSEPVSIDADATVSETIRRMSKGGYRRLPIMAPDGTPSGMVGVRGLLHYLVDHFPETIYNLPPKPGSFTGEREGA